MKTPAKVILLLLVAVVGITHLYRESQVNAVEEARVRLLATLDSTKVNTTSTRTSNTQKYCTKPRADLVSTTDKDSTTSYFNTLKMYFSIDPINLIKAGLTMNMVEIQTAAQSMITGFAIYVGPFVIALFLSLTLWTCLCCCCSCPSCCPSKCCQHDENLLYTKCEMLWPVIFLVVALLLACAASVPGIMRASTVADSIQTMQCGVAISLDDILNGNISSDQSTFFLGTNTMVSRLADLQGNITSIITDLSGNLTTDVDNIKNNYTNAKTNIDMLPNGTTANTSYQLVYNNPLLATSATVPSSFGTVLGVASNSSTLTGILFLIVDGIGSAMTSVSSALTALNAASPTIAASLGTTKDTVANYSTMLSDVDVSIGTLFSSTESLLPYVKLAFLGFFGAVLGFSVIALLGVIVMACFNKAGCRYLMYFSCVFMTLITILGSVLSFFLSILVPILFLTCSVLNTGIDSSSSFTNMTSTLGIDPNITGLVSVCLTGGDGQILNKMGSVATDINTNINGIMTTMNTSMNYGSYDTSGLTTAMNNITDAFTDYITAKRNDITYDSSLLDIFKSIANKSKYGACSGDANFDADSLVPSTDALSTASIPCATTPLQSACTSFAIGPCPTGCLDLNSIFVGYGAGAAATISTDILARYPTAPCATAVKDDIVNLYTAWHTPRIDATSGIASVKARYDSGAKTDVDNIKTTLTALSPKMTSTFTSLNTTLNPLLDPSYGLIAGINCILIGEDIVLTKNTLCVSLFNSFYFLFVTIGTSSIAFLFSMCCIVCSGVRHYKQSQKKQGQALAGDSQTYIGKH